MTVLNDRMTLVTPAPTSAGRMPTLEVEQPLCGMASSAHDLTTSDNTTSHCSYSYELLITGQIKLVN